MNSDVGPPISRIYQYKNRIPTFQIEQQPHIPTIEKVDQLVEFQFKTQFPILKCQKDHDEHLI